MTQESLMMNLNKSLSSLNYPELNIYKIHSIKTLNIAYIVIMSFLPALRTFLLSEVFDILAFDWVVLCMVLKRVHKC